MQLLLKQSAENSRNKPPYAVVRKLGMQCVMLFVLEELQPIIQYCNKPQATALKISAYDCNKPPTTAVTNIILHP